jgi:hypothetical protein
MDVKGTPPEEPTRRLDSLDALRGLDMAALLIVDGIVHELARLTGSRRDLHDLVHLDPRHAHAQAPVVPG